ncbi:hypothetical protein SAMN04489720_1981 [Agrococcus jejuensis]|uniref:Uncharacterized protein n=1 Tax=Agrococcus jejuensis TaxID=399736 RepID=A0A1G8ED48_9MICO|nr:hypothetical protein SAMN04489720_1981 [Agrococcus jejuensis]
MGPKTKECRTLLQRYNGCARLWPDARRRVAATAIRDGGTVRGVLTRRPERARTNPRTEDGLAIACANLDTYEAVQRPRRPTLRRATTYRPDDCCEHHHRHSGVNCQLPGSGCSTQRTCDFDPWGARRMAAASSCVASSPRLRRSRVACGKTCQMEWYSAVTIRTLSREVRRQSETSSTDAACRSSTHCLPGVTHETTISDRTKHADSFDLVVLTVTAMMALRAGPAPPLPVRRRPGARTAFSGTDCHDSVRVGSSDDHPCRARLVSRPCASCDPRSRCRRGMSACALPTRSGVFCEASSLERPLSMGAPPRAERARGNRGQPNSARSWPCGATTVPVDRLRSAPTHRPAPRSPARAE